MNLEPIWPGKRGVAYEAPHVVPYPEDYEEEIEALEGFDIESFEDAYGPLGEIDDHDQYCVVLDTIYPELWDVATRMPLTAAYNYLCYDVSLEWRDIASIKELDRAPDEIDWHDDEPPYAITDVRGNIWIAEEHSIRKLLQALSDTRQPA